jgi:tetratricopeptide (TPR) repeat protein
LDLAKPAFRKHGNDAFEYSYHLIVLNRLGKHKEWKEAIRKASEALESDAWFHFNLACFYSMTGEPGKALAQLEKAAGLGWEPNSALFISGTVKDPLLDPLRSLPEFQAWEKRFSPPYKDYSGK